MTAYLQGRLFATNDTEAMEKLHQGLGENGYKAVGKPKLKPANVQYSDEIWVEWHCAVEELCN